MAHDDPQLRARIAALENHELARMLTVDADNYRDEALEIGREEAGRRKLDVSAAARELGPGPSTELAATKLPSMKFVQPFPIRELVGFRWAACLLALSVGVELFGEQLAEPGSPPYRAMFQMVLFAGIFEYLRIVYRMHAALRIATAGGYPVTPWFAVVGHFVPLYNIYWLHAWTVRVNQCAAKNGLVGRSTHLAPTVLFLLGLMPGFHSLSVRIGLFFAAASLAQRTLLRVPRPPRPDPTA